METTTKMRTLNTEKIMVCFFCMALMEFSSETTLSFIKLDELLTRMAALLTTSAVSPILLAKVSWSGKLFFELLLGFTEASSDKDKSSVNSSNSAYSDWLSVVCLVVVSSADNSSVIASSLSGFSLSSAMVFLL